MARSKKLCLQHPRKHNDGEHRAQIYGSCFKGTRTPIHLLSKKHSRSVLHSDEIDKGQKKTSFVAEQASRVAVLITLAY